MRRCILALAAFCLAGGVLRGQTVLNLVPPAAPVQGSTPVTITVRIDNVQELTAASVTVSFNSSLVAYNGATQGGFLANAAFFVRPPGVNDPNTVTVDQAILGGGTVSGSGVLCTLSFTPKKACTVPFTIASAALKSPGGAEIPATYRHCTAEILASVSCRAMLQGAFDPSAAKMRASLNASGALPLTQPYGQPPWKYSGTEAVVSGFFAAHPDIVDWVLVELRSGSAANSTLRTRAGFIRRDGSVTETDGASPIQFAIGAGMYCLVIRHRNHCALMTRTPVSIDIATPVVDFTAGPETVYGGGQCVLLASGMYGMPAGDANGDGRITGSDFNAFSPAFISLASGYRQEDISMDSFVNGSDFNLFLPNFLSIVQTAVPFN